jgi:WD40-like Beta Propeller Repeat
MALDAGVWLGPYEIVSPAGVGGMGEVYRARDTRLDRTVAIKILPTALAGDPGCANASIARRARSQLSTIRTSARSTTSAIRRAPTISSSSTRHFAFTAVTGGADAAPKPAVVKIGSLDSTDTVALFNAESAVAYADGHLLFLAEDSLMAQRSDPDVRQFTGDPFPVAEDVGRSGSRYASFSVSPSGTLVYAHGVPGASVLQWFDRSGRVLGQAGEPANYRHVSLSPDERRVAASIGTGLPINVDIWTIDVARNVTSRLTFDPARENTPVWSPDSLRVLFSSTQGQADVGLHQKLWTERLKTKWC